VVAGLVRWTASDRLSRGFITDPLTFLNQERWKDTPPAGRWSHPVKLKFGGEDVLRTGRRREAAC
jgi:hypothetical protein